MEQAVHKEQCIQAHTCIHVYTYFFPAGTVVDPVVYTIVHYLLSSAFSPTADGCLNCLVKSKT